MELLGERDAWTGPEFINERVILEGEMTSSEVGMEILHEGH